MRHLTSSLGIAGLLAAFAAPACAQESTQTNGVTFRFEGRLGAEYNSNVSVADLDTNTGEGDWAATIGLLAEATLIPVDKLTLRAGYDFSQSLYQEFDAFDLGIHRGYAEIAYDFDIATVGVLGNLAQANLDGDEYLTYTQISPYLSKQFGNTLFLRGAYANTEKEFEGRPERDATADSIQLDAYFFLDGVQRYFVVGGKATQEDAQGDANSDEFDYQSGTFKARFVQRFDAMGREVTFRIGAEYEDRDYDNPNPNILPLPAGTPRSDKRTVIDTQLDIPLGDHFFSEILYKYGNYSSNLTSANYDEHVGAIKIGVRY